MHLSMYMCSSWDLECTCTLHIKSSPCFFSICSLLKAHALEARSIIRQALDVLTPVVPVRMEDANATLVHWTKKIIVEEGHSVAQLIHMLYVANYNNTHAMCSAAIYSTCTFMYMYMYMYCKYMYKP